MESDTLKAQLKQIEAAFQKALANPDTENSLLTSLKKDIDWCREKYREALEEESRLKTKQ